MTLDAEVAASFDRIRSRAHYMRTRGRRSGDVLLERRGQALLAQLAAALREIEREAGSVPGSGSGGQTA